MDIALEVLEEGGLGLVGSYFGQAVGLVVAGNPRMTTNPEQPGRPEFLKFMPEGPGGARESESGRLGPPPIQVPDAARGVGEDDDSPGR